MTTTPQTNQVNLPKENFGTITISSALTFYMDRNPEIVNQVFDAEKQGGEDGENEAINQYSSSQEAAIYINNLMERYEVLMSGQLDEYGIEYEPLEEEYLREKLKDLTNRFIKEFVREKKGVSKPFVYIYTISSRNPMTAAQILYAQLYESFKQ